MSQKPEVSFELFPPKTDAAKAEFLPMVAELARLTPTFMSVTNGAGGSAGEWNLDMPANIQRDTGIVTAAHLPCINKSRDDIDQVAETLWNKGVHRIVALRGDRPVNAVAINDNVPQYRYAHELVTALRLKHAFDISVAAYPEKHPEADTIENDIGRLKEKCDAGATRALTQLFYDNDVFYRFLEKTRAAGITTPIIPGLLPVQSHQQLLRVTATCQANIPGWLHAKFDGLDNKPEEARKVGEELMIAQVQDLLDHGITQFHFYTLNKATMVSAVCKACNLTP